MQDWHPLTEFGSIEDVTFFAMLIDIQTLQFPGLIHSQTKDGIDDLENDHGPHDRQQHGGTRPHGLSNHLIRISFEQAAWLSHNARHRWNDSTGRKDPRQQSPQRSANSVNAKSVQ